MTDEEQRLRKLRTAGVDFLFALIDAEAFGKGTTIVEGRQFKDLLAAKHKMMAMIPQLTSARSECNSLRERVKEAEANAKLFAQLTINLSGALLCLSNCYWNKPKDRYGYGPELGCHPFMGKHARHAWEAAESALDAMTTKKPDGEIQMHGDLYHKAIKVVGKHEPCYSKKALASPPGRKENES